MDVPMPPLLVAAVVALAVGLYFLTQGGARVRRGRDVGRSAHTATAQITDLRLTYPRRNRQHDEGWWVPVVRFALPDGRMVEAETLAGSNPPPGTVGDRVAVRYDPDDPARVNLARGLEGLGGMWVAVGVAVTGVGLLVLAAWFVLAFVLKVPA